MKTTVVWIGRLTRDVELRYTGQSGTAVCDLGLAADDGERGDRKGSVFIDCTCWGQQAEFANEYLSKGSLISAEGRLVMDQWEDKQSGQKRSKLKLVANSITSLERGTKKGGGGGQGQGQQADGGYDAPAGGDNDVPF